MSEQHSPLIVVASGAASDADGAVHGYRLEADRGRLTGASRSPVENPSFLALGPDRRRLYAVERVDGGAVSAFRFDPETGAVELLNRQSSEGAGPCYVSVDGEYAYAANYRGGTVAMLPIDDEGRLEPACDVVRHEGSGADPDRQAAPHPHFVAPGPDGRYVYAADLGTDRIAIYRPDAERGRLRPADASPLDLHDGAGPRHLAFHPNERVAYVVNELESTVTVLERDRETGALEPIETVDALPPGTDVANDAADVHVHPSGRRVYATNRGHDSVAIFATDADGRSLTPLGHESTRGETPRTFAVTPDGSALVVANQHGESVITFAVDDDGRLTATDETAVGKPVCVVALERR